MIDLRVDLPTGFTIEQVEALHQRVIDQYPGRLKRVHVEGAVTVGAEPGFTSKQTETGFVFQSSDGLQVCQFRLDGFSFSRLRPYKDWRSLSDEARRLWAMYKEELAPLRITRIAVRYINQIDIPLPAVDYKDYFRTTPEVSPDLPQGLSGFFMQLQFPLELRDGYMVLTQTAVAAPKPDMHSVILDLDAHYDGPEVASDEEVWARLEELRDVKNHFFEGSITERTRELFGERIHS